MISNSRLSNITAPVQHPTTALQIDQLKLSIQGQPILHEISLSLPTSGITALIGPSGAGKSSLLHCINLLQQAWQGEITLHQKSIRQWPGGDEKLRRHIGLVAQKPTVFPTTIYRNVVFGIDGFWQRRNAHAIAEQALRQAALWGEVKDRLHAPAASLSLGQQQRLCLARALAIKPKLLLLDEPTASLDPKSKQLIEQALSQLASHIPLLLVSHNLEQAQRLGEQVIFMCEGKVIEQADCDTFFNHPQRVESKEFLRWAVCECD